MVGATARGMNMDMHICVSAGDPGWKEMCKVNFFCLGMFYEHLRDRDSN